VTAGRGKDGSKIGSNNPWSRSLLNHDLRRIGCRASLSTPWIWYPYATTAQAGSIPPARDRRRDVRSARLSPRRFGPSAPIHSRALPCCATYVHQRSGPDCFARPATSRQPTLVGPRRRWEPIGFLSIRFLQGQKGFRGLPNASGGLIFSRPPEGMCARNTGSSHWPVIRLFNQCPPWPLLALTKPSSLL